MFLISLSTSFFSLFLIETDLLPMPILEKMDFSGSTTYKSPKRVPSPLQVLPDNLPEGLEPPLISPAYPVCHQGDTLIADGENAAETFIDVVAIQAPDVTSTGEDISGSETLVKEAPKCETESVTSIENRMLEEVLKTSEYKKVRKKANIKNKKKGCTKQSSEAKGAIKPKQVRNNAEMITDLYIIGPESVIKQENGEERYKCQKCDKLCKYPVGLKIHLRTYHHYINVHIKGIAKMPWARGIALKREREKQHDKFDNPSNDSKDGSWKSVDCSVVQSALEKLKDGQEEAADRPFEGVLLEKAIIDKSPENGLSAFSQSFQNSPDKTKVLHRGDENSNDMFSPLQLDELDGTEDATKCDIEQRSFSDKHASPPPSVKSEVETPLSNVVEESKQFNGNKSEILSSTTQVDSKRQSVNNTTPKKGSSPDKQQKSPGGIFPKKFACNLCHQAFAYKVWRDRHLRMHSESSTGHNCDVCNLKFFSKKDLIVHRKNQHGIDPKPSGGTSKMLQLGRNKTNEGNVHPKLKIFKPASQYGKPGEKGKSNMNLEKLVQTLQKIQDKQQSNKVAGKKGHKKKRERSSITKGYLCRLCGSAFSNPSNRSRHMRVQHGLSARKKVVDSRMKEKKPDIVMTKDDVSTGANPGNPPEKISDGAPSVSVKKRRNSLSQKVKKRSLPHSLKHSPPHKKGYCPAEYGYWSKVPNIKAKENKVVAHQRNRSKRKSLFPFDPMEYQEFPRTPDISCPWDRVNEPSPFVPKQKDVPPIRLHLMKLEESKSAGYQSIDSEVIDLRIKGAGLSKSNRQYLQPLDLTYPPLAPSRDDSYDDNPYIYNLLNHSKEEPLENLSAQSSPISTWKRAKVVRPRVKITSKMSSMKSLKNVPFINPVKWHFTCNICSSNFMSIRELSQHVVAHAEDYPYKCEFCMYVFTSSDDLWDHKESKHSVKKMYVCSLCKQEFAYLSNLEKHQGEAHTGLECTFNENLCNDVRPQNFTDPTKAFNLRACPLQVTERMSYLKEEMSKLSPLKLRIFGQVKEKEKAAVISPKKSTPEKGMLFNPQRNHPFEQRRKIGFLSMLSDPRNQKQLGSKVNNVCTKCLLEFKDTSAFHIHIMECANIKEEDVSEPADESEDDKGGGVVQKKVTKEHKRFPKGSVLNVLERRGRKRARPGSIIYDPQKYARVKSTSAFDDIHACAGCGKKFYFINKLERHMKMCPNREKIVNANKTNVALALRKRPRLNTMQHKCTNCDKHFTYLGSLEKHLLMCTSLDVIPPPPPVSDDTADHASTNQKKSLPDLVPPPDNMSEADSEQSQNVRQRRKRITPYWRLAENSL